MKTLALYLTALLSLSLSTGAVEETYRIITSTDGKEIRAWIRKVENDQVTFRRDDNQVFTIPLSRLSQEDQVVLRKMQVEKPAAPEKAGPEPKVNKRLYPRSLADLRTGVEGCRLAAKNLKGFTAEETEALQELNIYRFLSGVPSNVTLDRNCCDIAVKAAEGCAKIGQLSHDAAPEGKSCNLHGGPSSFPSTVQGYMNDHGDHNRAERGHRMWCLLPDLGKTGFGCDSTKSYYGMWVSNGGLAPPAKGKRGRQEFYAYPGNGFYPANRFHGNGWSVYPGTALPKGQDVEVKVYELTQRPENAPTAATLAKAAKEVKVDYTKRNGDQGGWEGGWLVFEPQVTVEPGKIVWVSMKCGAVRISYVVEFIDGQF